MLLRAEGVASINYDLVYYLDESKFTPEEKEAFDRLKVNPETSEYIDLEQSLFEKYAVKLVQKTYKPDEFKLIEVTKREFEKHPLVDKDGKIFATAFLLQQLLTVECRDKLVKGEEVFCHICGDKIVNDGIIYFNDLKVICKNCHSKIHDKKNKKENDKDADKNIRGSYSVL